MGGGSYSVDRSLDRRVSYNSMDRYEIFSSRTINSEMDPRNTIRESCDSDEHPETIPIIIGLDVTGSMGHVPEQFIRESMTSIMDSLYQKGLKDSQILFLGIGDHECDKFPLQVGQFESDDELLDKWLKNIYLEGGGGGNGGESYMLAWLYAARHTRIDSFEKRSKKGYVFTIGDEPNLKRLDEKSIREIFGADSVAKNITSDLLYREASEKYNVFHIGVTETSQGSRVETQREWREALGNHYIMVERSKEIPSIIASIIINELSSSNVSNSPTVLTDDNTEESEEIIL